MKCQSLKSEEKNNKNKKININKDKKMRKDISKCGLLIFLRCMQRVNPFEILVLYLKQVYAEVYLTLKALKNYSRRHSKNDFLSFSEKNKSCHFK